MAHSPYIDQVNSLVAVVDIAIIAISIFPPKGVDESQLNQMLDVYSSFKQRLLYPLPQYKNLRSLQYVKSDIFTYFDEDKGPSVDYFWAKIKSEALPYRRKNKLAKVLKRGKIKSELEHEFVIDVIVPYQQEGLITEEEVSMLNKMISIYERKK